jgi:hypothetical protein
MTYFKSNLEGVIFREKAHKHAKQEIAGRVQVLRVLVQRYYADRREKYSESDYTKHCEAVIDNMLVKYEYNVEHIIDKWRTVAPELKIDPIVCKGCGYRPPFCGYEWESVCSHLDIQGKLCV